MKTILFAAAAAMTMAAPAVAWEGRTVACFDKVWVGPTYATSKKLVMAPHDEYKHTKHGVELVRYDAVYREYKHKVSDGHWVMKEVPCACNC